MESSGVGWVDHYIDDFVTLGPPQSKQCQSNMEIMHEVCDQLGLPIEPERDKGPATVILFLGTELDSTALEIRLPAEKLDQLRKEMTTWRKQKASKKRELLSLIGRLSNACKAREDPWVPSAWTTMCDLINAEARSDFEWWAQYATIWNGVAMMHVINRSSPGALLTTAIGGVAHIQGPIGLW